MSEQLATESHQLREQKIHKIHAAMEFLVYGAEEVTTSKRNQFLVCLKRTRQAATKWLDANHEKAIERLEREIHQMTPFKHMLFNKIIQQNEPQLLQEVMTKATGRGAHSPKNLLK